ncbi:MAG: LIC_12708 family protein [Spirochaetota bacterium]
MKKTAIAMMLIALCTVSCSQWKVSELKGKRIVLIPAGVEANQINFRVSENDILDISFDVKASRDCILVSDNKMKRVHVFDMDGSPVLSIGPKKIEKAADAGSSSANFNFGIIGVTACDSDGKIYVQNRIESRSASQYPASPDDLEILPSYILVFDKKGNLQYTMGQKGAADLPFYYIENITVDEKDRLFVISKSINTWNIYRFKSKARDFYANIGQDSFKENEGSDEYNGIVENILPFHSGDKLLVSVAYYHNTRFKYRKIYEYLVGENKFGRAMFTVQDPKNELFSILDDKYILLWDTEEKDVRFVIWDFDGNIVNNLKIKNDQMKSYYREIISDESGNFFSFSARKTGLEIMGWK